MLATTFRYRTANFRFLRTSGKCSLNGVIAPVPEQCLVCCKLIDSIIDGLCGAPAGIKHTGGFRKRLFEVVQKLAARHPWHVLVAQNNLRAMRRKHVQRLACIARAKHAPTLAMQRMRQRTPHFVRGVTTLR